MAKKKLLTEELKNEVSAEEEKSPLDLLGEMIIQCGQTKDELSLLKVNETNQINELKLKMKEVLAQQEGKWKHSAGKYTATLSVTETSSMNDEKLMEFLKRNISKDVLKKIIRKKEYIDGDALENAIYNGDITPNQLAAMDTCKETKSSETLRITKSKKGE